MGAYGISKVPVEEEDEERRGQLVSDILVCRDEADHVT